MHVALGDINEPPVAEPEAPSRAPVLLRFRSMAPPRRGGGGEAADPADADAELPAPAQRSSEGRAAPPGRPEDFGRERVRRDARVAAAAALAGVARHGKEFQDAIAVAGEAEGSRAEVKGGLPQAGVNCLTLQTCQKRTIHSSPWYPLIPMVVEYLPG